MGEFAWIVKFALRMFTFMTHFGENKLWQQKKLFLSLIRIDFAVAVSSKAVCISSRAVRVFLALIISMHMALIRDLFSYGFTRKLRMGPYGSHEKKQSFWARLFNPRLS